MIENFRDKKNTNGFDKNPQNINTNGRPASIRNELKELIERDGEITIPAFQVRRINEDGSVVLNLPTQEQLAMKLIDWAVSKKGNDSLKAIQMIMEQIDGRPEQKIELQKEIEITLDI
ncbi:conserved hypothetical protein [uncultured Paludibacter sp.]|uniref:Uncharacterized protein n=1 Tax=uncultured Paludibacter sp. TaxID=497635 RepID=A0A653AJX8_9BACT|nr:conserved hypothetical protein [uncultured Paludibacter sp.]